MDLTKTRSASPAPAGPHPQADRRPYLREVADGVYAYVQPPGGWNVSNAGIILGPDRVAVVDTTATEARARALREHIRTLTSRPVRLVVNTHFHGDHTFGNGVVGAEAVIVAHELAREEMIATGTALTRLWPRVNWGEVEPTPPQLTYRDGLTLWIGERRAELIHVGPAHSTNDTAVWLPEERVLFAGDVLMSGCTPFVLMGSVAGSLAAIERLRALEPGIVVGGHGAVSGPEVLDQTADYLRWLGALAEQAAAAGAGPLEAARQAELGPYAHWQEPERIVGNLHRAFAELATAEGGAPALGAPLDVVGIFGELVEYNGGRLPECYA
jgi:cyclase